MDKMKCQDSPKKKSEIEAEMYWVTEEIETIKSLIAEHRNRIGFALEPERPESKGKEEASTAAPLSPLGKSLQGLHYQLRGISTHLRDLTSRVAL